MWKALRPGCLLVAEGLPAEPGRTPDFVLKATSAGQEVFARRSSSRGLRAGRRAATLKDNYSSFPQARDVLN
jgi:hypothetical protein